MSAKYDLVPVENHTLRNLPPYRVRALKDICSEIQAGTLGGYVDGEHNLSQHGSCWISDEAQAIGDARVIEDARVTDKARISDRAVISGSAYLVDNAIATGSAKITGKAHIRDTARVGDFARVGGISQLNKILAYQTV